jgi:GT2 family glycosyltransferase/glycosyltransferase involved in cell wall biosynthesis
MKMNDQTRENEQIVERTDLQFHQSKLLEKQQKLERLYLNDTLKRSYLSPVRPFRQILKIVYWTITFQIADRLKRRQIAHLIGRSGLFDTGYYYRQNPEVEALGIDPLGHYLDVGAASGRNPHPLFDMEYYLKNCPEAADSGMNPLAHYITLGSLSGRNPHPLFDTEYYLKTCPEAADSGINPLAHYITLGSLSGRNPHPLFDTGYYRKICPEVVSSATDPLVHYLTIGSEAGYNPHPLFDVGYYRKNYPEVIASGIDPLLHCVESGIENTPYSSLLADRLSSVVAATIDTLTQTELSIPLEREARTISFPVIENPRVSIIIPVYNQIHYTLRCLKGLALQITDLSFEVIVVDDSSNDTTSEILALIEGLLYLRNPENYGFLNSCNLAARQAKGDYLIFLNNDTVPFQDWLSEIIDPFSRQEKVGLVGSMLIYPNGTLQEAGGLIWRDGSGCNYGRNGDPEACEYNFVRETDYCSGASIALPSELWRQLQGFDPLFSPAYYEDTDLAFRVRKAGYKVIYTCFSKIIHFEGISSGTDLSKGVKRYQAVNKPKFLKRWETTLREHAEAPDWRDLPNRDHRVPRKLLMLDVTAPTPDRDSGSGDIFNFMKVAREADWAVTFIADNFLHEGDSPYIKNLQRIGIECIYRPYINSIEEYIELQGNKFDIIVLSRVDVASLYIDVVRRYAPNAKLIFNTVDLHFLRQSRGAAVLEKLDSFDEVARTFRDEIRAIAICERTIVVSQEEAELIKKIFPPARLSVIPIIRELPKTIQKIDFDDRCNIGFIGQFAHFPNRDAISFFITSIFPRISQEIPDCRLIIAGSNMPENIAKFASDRIVIKGYIADLHELFGSVRLSIAPLRFGAGMKGKIVSSLLYGVPVVATSIAVEGMGMTQGKEVLVADDPEEFARSIIDVYNSRPKWEALSAKGLEFATERFSLDVVGQKIRTTLAEVLAGLPSATQTDKEGASRPTNS